MKKKSSPKLKWAMAYGLYLGIFHILFLLFFYFRGNVFEGRSYGYVLWIFIAGVTWFGLVAYRDKVNGGFLSYGQGMGLGVLISVFGAIFYSATIYLLMTFDGSLSNQLMEITQEALFNSGLPDELMESMEKMYEITLKPGIVGTSEFIGKVFAGTFITLIVAAIVKRKSDNSFYDAVKDIEE